MINAANNTSPRASLTQAIGMRCRRHLSTMTCEIVGTERTLLVTWGPPELEDIDRVLEQIRIRTGSRKLPIFYVTRVPSDAPAPNSAVRRQLNIRLPLIIEHCAAYHVILEGDGFASAMKRGVLLSLFQLAPKRGLFHVHATVEAFRKKVPEQWQREVDQLLDMAQSRNLLIGHLPNDQVDDGSGSYAVGSSSAKKPGSSHVA